MWRRPTTGGWTSLMCASGNGYLEIVQALASAGTQILKAAQDTLHTCHVDVSCSTLLEVVASFMPILSVLYAKLCYSSLVLQQNYCQAKEINTRRALFELACHSCCFPCSAASCYFTKFGPSLLSVAILQHHAHLLFNGFKGANVEATNDRRSDITDVGI